MKGTDLKRQCDMIGELGGGCEQCAGKAYCDKWKELRDKISKLEPSEMEELIDLMEQLIHKEIYLKGEKFYERET